MTQTPHFTFYLATAFLALTFWLPLANSEAEELEFHFANGNVLTIDVETPRLEWMTVAPNGKIEKSKIEIAKIQSLVLTSSPASRQASEVGELLTDLADPDYLVRENAETKLSDPELSNGFKDMILALENDSRLEVKIRVKRILESLSESERKREVRFDTLTLTSGDTLQGDAGRFQLTGTFRGKQILINRNDLVQMRTPNASTPTAKVVTSRFTNLNVNPAHDYKDLFFLPNQITLDFSQAPNGSELECPDSVESVYVPLGMKLGSEQEKANIVVSSYQFDGFGTLARKNSIAVYDNVTTPPKRFKGNVTVDFCMPNQPSLPAGVKEFGMFIARVEEGRDFIIEGYNSSGHVVVTAECPSESCGFFGFTSNVPVTHLRILSNPYLFRIDRTIDDDYALDHFCFSPPQPVRLRPSSKDQVLLKNGNLIVGSGLKLTRESLAIEEEFAGKLDIPINQVAELTFASPDAFPTPLQLSQRQNWLATLNDGSQLIVDPGKTLKCKTTGQSFDLTELTALVSSKTRLRYPIAKDFGAKKPVAVYPTCRIQLDDFELSDTGIKWGAESKKLIQPVDSENPLGTPGTDPTPQVFEIDFEKTTPNDLPSIWFRSPRIPSLQMGMLRTRRGEQIVFGDGALFELEDLNDSEATFSTEDGSFSIGLEDIISLHWPNESARSGQE